MQRSLSGYGTFNYEELIGDLGYSSNSYIAPEYIQLTANEGWKGNVAGLITEIIIRQTKKGDMGKLTLDNNNELIDVVMWNDQWITFKDQLIGKEDCGLIVSGEIKYDSYNKKNMLYCDAETALRLF